MSTSINWDQYEIKSSPQSEEDDWSQYEVKPKGSRVKSLASAGAKGVIKGLKDIGDTLGGGFLGPIPKKLGERTLEQVLPSEDSSLERGIERAGRLAPTVAFGPGRLAGKALQTAGGALAGQLAQEEGMGELGQGISELVGMGIPGGIQAGTRKIRQLATREAEKLPSGLTKLRALDTKSPQLGILSSHRQKKVLGKLDQETSKLTKGIIEKHLPLSQEIEKGVDFEKKFHKGFGNLQQIASKANPEIDITNISRFLRETREKYRGIPSLHPQGKKVIQEARIFSNKPETSLKNLYKIYRSNNQKIKDIYETSRITGKQKEYVDFLTDFNRNIVKSLERTLPQDSKWLNSFKNLNKEYGAYQGTLKSTNVLRPFIKGEITPGKLEMFANNPKIQKQLALSMGEQGANEITQLAQDLKASRMALKKIPKTKWHTWTVHFPLGYFIPGLGKLTAGVNISRLAWGHFLSTSAKRKATSEALKAIQRNDLPSYIKATNILKKSLDEEEKEG